MDVFETMKKLTIAMPVYNEEKNVELVVGRLRGAGFRNPLELIIVDDCSSDGTRRIIDGIESSENFEVRKIFHERNMGKGAAIRTAMRNFTGDYFVVQDGDLEYDPRDIINLIEVMESENLKVVYGSRMKRAGHRYSYISYYLGNIFLNKTMNLLYGTKLSDMETCYKLIDSDIVKKLDLKANKFDMEPEITAKISLMGYKIREHPISYNPRSKEEGKKIKWSDGISALWTLVYWKFNGFSAQM